MDDAWIDRVRRRAFLRRTSALGAAFLLGLPCARADPLPEVRTLRLVLAETMCMAPQYIAEAMLRAEGFEQVEYVIYQKGSGRYSPIWLPGMLADGLVDITMSAVPGLVATIDRGGPIVILGGIHVGCYELFGHGNIRTIRDLKGRAIAVADSGDEQLFISSMMAYVGIDPASDVRWVRAAHMHEAQQLFIDRKVDAFLGFPPQPQELRARRIGQVFLSTAADKPWSQYFCCMVSANRDFVDRHPVATRRAMRALLKAADVCARQPEEAARFMVEKGYVSDMAFALGLMRDLPYDRWRTAAPEDTVRFYALRLHEVGLVSSNPQRIIERGTDWRFLNELKRELKS